MSEAGTATWQPAPCPDCGGPAHLRPAYFGHAAGTVYCVACTDRRGREVQARWPQWATTYPTLSIRCYRALSRARLGPVDLPAQTDAALLAVYGFGVGMLAEVRAVCPAPPPVVMRPCPHCGGTGRVTVEGA